MTKQTLPKWTEERTANLESIVEGEIPVSLDTVAEAANNLGTTDKSVAAKLRKLGYDVEYVSTTTKKAFSEEETEELRTFVKQNEGVYTFAEISVQLYGTEDKARQVQGKLLSMDMSSMVKPAPKKEEVKKYTDEEEDIIATMAKAGEYLEDIATALDRNIKSIRGKTLSMRNTHNIDIPKQRSTLAKVVADPIESITDIAERTVEEIATMVGKSIRGVKAMLTIRGIRAKNYDGKKRAAKIAKAKSAETVTE